MNNFVFHEEYIIDVPKDRLSDYLLYITDYGLYGKEPKLKGFELSFWRTIQRRIDNDKNLYSITCLRKKISNIKNRIANNRDYPNDKENLEQCENELEELTKASKKSRITENTVIHSDSQLVTVSHSDSHKVTPRHSESAPISPHDIDIDSEYEFDSDIEYEFEYDIDTEGRTTETPDKNTPSQTSYSKKIFTLFKDAGLPCSRENEISFLQTDFSNALNYLHKTPEYKSISSEDVIGAVKNYIQVYSDSDSYVTNKMNFFSLVKSKMFYNLLPANFDAGNFRKFGADKEPQKEDQKPKIKTYRKCPKCKVEKLWYNSKTQSYFCDNCFSDVRGDEL